MKNIYFVEASFSFDKDVYLPYATGTIAAYLKKKGCFDEKFNMAGFIYRKEETDSIIGKLDEPYIVGFSCCIWNMEFNLKLSEKIKEKYPSCIIVFGGHSVTDDNRLLKEYPFIDILMFGEGERTFLSLLGNVGEGKLLSVNNISFRKNGNIFSTPLSPVSDLSDLPSPYTEGIFDEILKTENHASLLAVLETNRGCPYSCSYCDWCSGKKVRLFPKERVYGDILWFAENGIEYCFCADSNFGMFPRDVEIASFAAEAKKKYGYPKVFRTCFAKESNDTVFRISKILNDGGMDKGATMAYQTLSEDALKNIHRKNLTLEHFSDLQKKYNDAGIPTYSELILGLPGETKDSFCKGLCRLLESGQHNSLSVYYLEVLPNSEMAKKSFIKKHGIKTIRVSFNHMHSIRQDNEIEEFSNIVRSTATMSEEDWVYCNLFSICIEAFHALGFLRFIAMYLNEEKGVSYYDFYEGLLGYIMNEKPRLLYSLFSSFEEKLSSSLPGEWNFTHSDFGEVSWAFEEGAYLSFLKNSEKAYAELDTFLSGFFSDKELYSELISYQKNILRKKDSSVLKSTFSYDFLSFFDALHSGEKATLKKENAVYTFGTFSSFSDWKTFAKEVVWFGRRKGATIISNRPNAESEITKELL